MNTIYTILTIAALITLIAPGFWLAIGLILSYITLLIPAIMVHIMYRTGSIHNGLYRALDWFCNWTMNNIDRINSIND
jgi:hypothetical protein